jgi:opacity protein-like surface antigen
MFRKTTLLVAALALSLVVPQAQAAKGDWMIDFNGGTAMPMSNFKDVAKLGFMGGVGAGYMVTDAVCVGVDGSYVKNSPSDDLKALIAPATIKFSMIQGGAHAKFMFPMGEESKVSPYAVVGLGIYNLKEKAEFSGVSSDTSVSKIGGRGGLGVSYKASENVSVGVEGNFNLINTDWSYDLNDPTAKNKTNFIGVQAVVTVAMSKK